MGKREASNEVREGSKRGAEVTEGPGRSSNETGGPLPHLPSRLPIDVGAKVSDDKTHLTDDKT